MSQSVIEYNVLENLITCLDFRTKLQLFKTLSKQTYAERTKQFQKKMSRIPISDEEILKETEIVRKQIYESCH